MCAPSGEEFYAGKSIGRKPRVSLSAQLTERYSGEERVSSLSSPVDAWRRRNMAVSGERVCPVRFPTAELEELSWAGLDETMLTRHAAGCA